MNSTKGVNQNVLTDETLETPFAEAYRALRANITFSSLDKPVRTILVASAAPDEGRTTTVINLGIIMAQSSSTVVIVDADFRDPAMHERLGIHANGYGPMRGLSDVLVGAAKPDQVLLATPFPRLGLMPAGSPPRNPSELLSSERMRSILSALLEYADIVLLDSPACCGYADALLLSRIVDGVLYVVRSGFQDKSSQRRVQKQLQQAKARMLGVVFNDVDPQEGRSMAPATKPHTHRSRRRVRHKKGPLKAELANEGLTIAR